MNIHSRLDDIQQLEARLATRLASSLSVHASQLSHDVTERLRFAREQALGRAQALRLATDGRTSVLAGISSSGAATLYGLVPWWQRAASVVPLVMLVAGLLVIDHWAVREQVVAAADFDAQLLADDLPPAAYSDPGFAEFLRATPTP